MNNEDKIKSIRDFALNKARKNKEIELVEEKVAQPLPEVYKPKEFLSIARSTGTNTINDLVAKYAIQGDDYEGLVISEDTSKKVKKHLGRMVTGVGASIPIICRGDNCSYRETCVTGDTLILTKKGLKQIKDVTTKDKVYSLNLDSMLLEEDNVLNSTSKGTREVWLLTTRLGNSLKLTSDHKVLSYSATTGLCWNSLDCSLKVGSSIVSIDGEEDLLDDSLGDCFTDVITEISLYSTEEVFDIEVENNSNFVANNIIVHNCPLFKDNVHPLGERCPIEVGLIEAWAQDFIIDLKIDPNSITEIHALSRILEITVLEYRLTTFLSLYDQDLTIDTITSVTPEGEPIYNKAPSIAFEQRERLSREKIKHLETLNATRERKQKLQNEIEKETKIDTSYQDVARDVREIARQMKLESSKSIVKEVK